MNIVALRGPQQGIYAFVWTGYGDEAVGMLGIGVYGFEGMEFVGVTTESLDWLKKKIEEGDLDIPAKFKTIDLHKGQRFNQGDAFFAAHLGQGIPATPPGEAGPTIMSEIIKNMTPER